MNTANMPVPVKKSPPSHELFATYVKFIAGCLTGNSDCPNPTPSVASLISQADAMAQANVKAKFFRFHAHTPKGMGPSSDPVKWMVR